MTDRPSSRVLLVGPPNVGKSVLFNRLTGLSAGVSNYPGTTVEFAEGQMTLEHGGSATVIDAPGTYSLQSKNEAERVTTRLLDSSPDLVLGVLDALRPETGLYLALDAMNRGHPVILVVNRIDLARERGYAIDVKALSDAVGVPVLATSGASGLGIDDVRRNINHAVSGERPRPARMDIPNWETTECLAGVLRRETGDGRHRGTTSERLEDLLIRPWPGFPLALVAVAISLGIVVGVGMGLRQYILLPLIRDTLLPIVASGVQSVVSPGVLREIMVGEYGFLTKGIEWPLTLVLPYVVSFYFVLSFLEDSGYLPRLAALIDGMMARLGLSGAGIMPLLLGYGCGIPAIMATRTLETRRERLTVASMICLAVPCIAQTGAFIALLAEASIFVLLGVFAISIGALIMAGMVLGKILRGTKPGLVMEIPELLLPRVSVMLTKVWARAKHYLMDGVVPVMLGVAFAALVHETGAIDVVGRYVQPLVTGWLGLPERAAVPLLLGIFRRELTVLPLLDMDLTALQLFTGAVVGLFYVPCIAMLSVLAKEFRASIALIILGTTTAMAFLMGGLLTRIISLFMM